MPMQAVIRLKTLLHENAARFRRSGPALLLVGLLAVMTMGCGLADLPDVKEIMAAGRDPSRTSQLLARDGTVIMAYGKYHHKPLPLSGMSPYLTQALLATEDQRFYEHYGVDPIGVGRAILRDVSSGSLREGGSSITQQLARTLFLSNDKTFSRKIRETLLAVKLEQELTKEQILELYLNNVYFGEGAYGVGAASQVYFNKDPKNLTRAEAALLAGMPQAPSRYNPFVNPKLAKARRDHVIEKLVQTGKIARADGDRLKRRPLGVNPAGRALSEADKAPWFNRMVLREALKKLDMAEDEFWPKKIKVYTTLDAAAQLQAQEAVRNYSAKYGRTGRNQQAALLSMSRDGAIRAYVGGRDFSVSQYDRVSLARRQTGSLFKIFVYLTALERDMSPRTVFLDSPVRYGNWMPHNYDGYHYGYMTLARALAKSNNIIAVKVAEQVSTDAVIATARRLGIQSPMENTLPLALGAADASLMEMTTAFNTLNNNGIQREPYAILKIVDRNGKVLYQRKPAPGRQVVQRPVRDSLVKMMTGVVKHGTARNADIPRPVAGKTGTSDGYRNAWFIGFTPDLTTGVWVGNDDNSPTGGITGGSLPAVIWRSYMASRPAIKKNFELAHAMPFDERDFFEYDLANLSRSEEAPFWDWLFGRQGRSLDAEDVRRTVEAPRPIPESVPATQVQPVPAIVPPPHAPVSDEESRTAQGMGNPPPSAVSPSKPKSDDDDGAFSRFRDRIKSGFSKVRDKLTD